MESLALKEILSALPKIHSGRNYWFVRTHGGLYYDDFLKSGFIAINYDRIPLSDIEKVPEKDLMQYTEVLGQKIRKAYKEDEYRPNYAASQLIKFVHSIKKGDIVLIPSFSSSRVAFGEVTDTKVYLQKATSDDIGVCPWNKRKKVRWLASYRRDDLDPNLFKLMFSHHAISEADYYGEYIDRITNSLFLKNDAACLVLNVQTTEKIKAIDLFEMGTVALRLLDDFCKEEGIPDNSESVDVKLNLQSPGEIVLMSNAWLYVVLLGIIFIGLAGGGFYITKTLNQFQAGIKSDGIIERIRLFLNSSADRKSKKEILEKHLEGLKIERTDDLIKLIESIDKKSKSE